MPFQFIRNELGIDFLGSWKWAFAFSTAVLLAGLIAYFPLGGFKYGIDFLGGTLVQVKFPESHELSEVRGALEEANLGAFELQSFGDAGSHEVLITLATVGQHTSRVHLGTAIMVMPLRDPDMHTEGWILDAR